MKQLTDTGNLDRFFAELAESDDSLLMLDYDGTLAPFVNDPMKAYPYPGVRERLQRITAQCRTSLAMVSGRSIDDLMLLLRIEPLPEIWGSHGLEHRDPDGTRTMRPLPERTREGFRRIRAFVTEHNLEPLTEYKLSGAAFHWRPLAPARASALRASLHMYWDTAAPEHGFDLHPFDGGIELRVAGVSKANAIEDLLADANPGTPAAFLGDDLTDEDGFRALKGRGVSALVRPEVRPTGADCWLVPPDELLAFLDRWIACTGKRLTP